MKYKYIIALFIIAPSSFFSFFPTVYASTIQENTTWTQAQSPYVITDELNLQPQATLTIEPGVIITFDGGHILAQGKINAAGTVDKPIIMNSKNYTGYITFLNSRYNSQLSNISFQHVLGGIESVNSTLTLQAVDISNAPKGIVGYAESIINLSHSKLHDLSGHALLIYGSSTLSINNSSIKDIKGTALTMYQNSFATLDAITTDNASDSSGNTYTLSDGAKMSISHSDINKAGFNAAIQASTNAHVVLDDVHLTGGQGNGILFFSATQVSITHSSFDHFMQSAILAYDEGAITIENSSIKNNTVGIQTYSPIAVTIHNSSITNNAELSVSNYSSNIIDAKHNWWGSIDGPKTTVSTNVDVIPWLTEDPTVDTSCCSNVLFIPGLQASRLYNKRALGTEDQLWEPNLNSDVEDLFLDVKGKSIDSTIYTRDSIAMTNYPARNVDIYEGFFDSLDDLVKNKNINSWKEYAYDWRLDINDLIQNGTKYPNNLSYKITSVVDELAKTSKTGKVTIITHSNGGLFAKALVKELQKQHKDTLIDNVIMVASPNIGTPKALASMLHGTGQEILKGVFLNESTARELAENMPGAYNLIPSKKYFESNKTPMIFFDASLDSLTNLHKIYGNSISTLSELKSFILGEKDTRKSPAASDLATPNVLNKKLLTQSTSFHDELDTWNFPSTINALQIVGTNIDTIQAIQYYKKSGFKEYIDYMPLFTSNGDGTVTSSSASTMSLSTYYIDIASYNVKNSENRSHATIMEIRSVKDLIKNIIVGKEDIPEFVLKNPLYSNATTRVSLHSPATIDVYDSQNRHVGLQQNSNSDFLNIDTQIPNSYYLPFGEGVYTGFDAHASSTIIINGAGTGTFTLNIETGNTKTVFEDVPVLPTTVAQLQISNGAVSTLGVDLDGDNKTDFIVTQQSVLNPSEYLMSIRKIVEKLDTNQKIKDTLLKKIDKITEQVNNGKIKNAEKVIKKFMNSVSTKKKHVKKLSPEDREILLTMINQLLDVIK